MSADDNVCKAYRRIVRTANKRRPRAWHPDDRKTERDGEPDGLENGLAFAEAFAPELAACIGIYGDEQAHEMLDKLRDDFWGCTPEEREKPIAKLEAGVSAEKDDWIEQPPDGTLRAAWLFLRDLGLGVNGADRQRVRDLAALLDAAEARTLRALAAWFRATAQPGEEEGDDPRAMLTAHEGGMFAEWLERAEMVQELRRFGGGGR